MRTQKHTGLHRLRKLGILALETTRRLPMSTATTRGVSIFFLLATGLFADPIDEALQHRDRLKPHQVLSEGEPPLAPERFNPDSTPTAWPPALVPVIELRIHVDADGQPLPPVAFNPDPGAMWRPAPARPFFETAWKQLPEFGHEPVAPEFRLPRRNLRRVELVAVEPTPFGIEPLPEGLELPRERVRANEPLEINFHAPHSDGKPETLPWPHTEPRPNRWRIQFISRP